MRDGFMSILAFPVATHTLRSLPVEMFPRPPKKDIDWANLSLSLNGNASLNGHVEVRHSLSTNKWSTPRIVADENIAVSGLSPGLNYGQQCYEGLKAFRSARPQGETITVFRPNFHAARMARSAEAVCLPAPSQELFLECLNKVIIANDEWVPPSNTESFLYIRPVLFGSSSNLALCPPEETIFAIFVFPTSPYHGAEAAKALVLEDFDRAAPKGMGAYKVGGNYAPVWRHAAKAKAQGYGLTLHLDSASQTYVEEFSTSGFVGHKKGQTGQDVMIIPDTENAIASATCDSLMSLARLKGWKIERIPVPFSSIRDLDEVVAVGTAAAAVPVESITRNSSGETVVFADGEKRLLHLAAIVADIQRGHVADTEGWCYDVVTPLGCAKRLLGEKVPLVLISTEA
ncbi:branched-chain-amino-acid aminotransferase [Periconia macrospinosa]|uniref:Branched-chain-amino-acid aminotransferase n=1 Tax=Periconia macrospinosa TaxID=97972 RepID=A0A2V1DNZ3_9PLEO|nr:branched-chain-amino-acid aminotransferase [Periconia macrospinosa]